MFDVIMLVCVWVCMQVSTKGHWFSWILSSHTHRPILVHTVCISQLSSFPPCTPEINSHLIRVWKLLTLVHTHVKWLLMTNTFSFFMATSLLQLLALLQTAGSAVCAKCFIMLRCSDDLTLIKSTNHVSRGETLYGFCRSLLVLLYAHVNVSG